jgi:hypothetical protein
VKVVPPDSGAVGGELIPLGDGGDRLGIMTGDR